MSNNDPLDPTGKNGTKKAPLGDPSAPPNPSTREAVSQASSKGGTSGTTSPGSTSSGTSATGSTTSSSSATGTGGTSGSSGSAGTANASGSGQSPEDKQKFRDEISETGEKLKSEAQDTARSFTEAARARAQEQAQRQQQAAAGELGGIANALRKTADEVQGQSYLPLDRYARQAADKLDELAQSLQGSDVRSVVGRLEVYARQQPGVVLGGAIISGFILARFLRASEEHQTSRGNTASTYGGRSASSTPSTSTGTGYSQGGRSVY